MFDDISQRKKQKECDDRSLEFHGVHGNLQFYIYFFLKRETKKKKKNKEKKKKSGKERRYQLYQNLVRSHFVRSFHLC